MSRRVCHPVFDVTGQVAPEAAREELAEAFGAAVLAEAFDVTDSAAVAGAVARIEDGAGPIDILVARSWSVVRYYHQLVNRRTDQVIGTGGRTNDANIGNGDVPDVRLEAPGSVSNTDIQYWHVVTEPKGGVTAEQVGRPRGGHLDGQRDGRPADRPVGRQQRHRQLEPQPDRRRVLQVAVGQEPEPVSDRRVRRVPAHRVPAHPAERDGGRLTGLGTLPVAGLVQWPGTRELSPATRRGLPGPRRPAGSPSAGPSGGW